MKTSYIMLALLSIGTLSIGTSNAQRERCDNIVARFLGGITGATFAAESYSYKCHYREGPAYDISYPGAPRYAYDYPTYMYSPVYSYMHVRHTIYPSYYSIRQ